MFFPIRPKKSTGLPYISSKKGLVRDYRSLLSRKTQFRTTVVKFIHAPK